ncbi:MAG: hypothetical protein HY868_04765 [Chloroflexi bacterium]|nr:hypothetical protein [Chloroflexota bacterium]
MTDETFEQCPGCDVRLPKGAGATHRYIGASSSCWEMFAALSNGGEPPLAPDPLNDLLRDAYAAQHPGIPSDQAIQSVAVHLLTLYGVLVRGIAPENALWIRLRAVREGKPPKHARFAWLSPPSFAGSLTIADIVRAPTLDARTVRVREYVQLVWRRWARDHSSTVAQWYDQFILPHKL